MVFHILSFAAALVVLAASATAGSTSIGEENDHGWDGWLMTKELEYRVNLDPVLRTIVCRIAYAEFSPQSLARAIRATPNKIMDAVAELERMKLIQVNPPFSFRGIIVPASRQARDLMRLWADHWCVRDNKCEPTH